MFKPEMEAFRKAIWAKHGWFANLDYRFSYYCRSNKRDHSRTYKASKQGRVKAPHKAYFNNIY